MVGWVAVSAAAKGIPLPSISPNALVAIRAAAARRTGLRDRLRELGLSAAAELWSDFMRHLSPEIGIPVKIALHQ
jgi:hypothetical protein